MKWHINIVLKTQPPVIYRNTGGQRFLPAKMTRQKSQIEKGP